MTPTLAQELRKHKFSCSIMDSGFVFCNAEGKPLDPDSLVKRQFLPALKAGELKKRTMYEARHTFATMMLSIGENPNWVAKMMGHTSMEMLFKKYSSFISNITHQDGTAFMGKLYKDGHFLDTCNK